MGLFDWLGQDWQKLLTGGLFGAGTIGNILEERKRMAYQNFIMSLLKHPEILAQMAAKIQRPLDASLIQGVTNTVQADMAQRGLSQAPGIFAATESQALAPYQQQNAQTAMNAVLSALGLPAGSFGQPTNTAGSLQAFLDAMKKKSGGGGASPTSGGGSSGDPTFGAFVSPESIFGGLPSTASETGWNV